MPYYYPPNYNGMMPPVQYFQQGFNPSNGQFLMNGPPSGHRPAGPVPQLALASIPDVAEHQKANTIQNDVNLKKATLRLEKDEENPGFHLVAFSFDATVSGRYVVICLCATDLLPPLHKLRVSSLEYYTYMSELCAWVPMG
jgi:E3 ubiquitin-protein ligase MGRN1